jgi:hypothetical protein
MTFFKWLKNKSGNESGFIGGAVLTGALWAGFIGVGAIVSTTFGAIAVGAIAGLIVGYAVESLAGSFMPGIIADSSTYAGDQPVYTVEEGKQIAKCYGRCLISGNIIRSNDPGETTIKVIIGHGQGEIDSLLSWKVNDIEWDHLADVNWEGTAAAAMGSISMWGIASVDETFVIDTQTFTWKTTRGGTGEVTIGATAQEAMANIVIAVTADLATVTAVDSGDWYVDVEAVTPGIAGNDIIFTTATTNLWMDGEGTLGGYVVGASNYGGSSHFKNTLLGTDSQNPIQVNGTDLFSLSTCAYRGIAHTGFDFAKTSQISNINSLLLEGLFGLCEPIGGGAKVFSRNPAVVMWDFYRNVEDYEIADLDENAFKSLESLCGAYPTSGDGGPIRPPGPNNTTVKATSYHDTRYSPFFAFDFNLATDGSHINTSWASTQGQTTNQRLNVDLGVPVVLTKIVLINSHIDGASTNEGIQNFVIQGSNTASDLDHTTYADAGSGWTNVQTGLTATQYDSADPYKNYEVASPGTAYRYYSIKIANNHGGGWLKVRDICFYGRSPRYTFDFNFDTEININDAKKLIWSSFNGRVIRSQGKLKPVWDWSTVADGSGGLTTKTSQYSFTMDNAVKDSFTWFPTKRANKIEVKYLDSSESFKKRTVIDKDDSDIETRGEVILDITAYYITQRDVAARRSKRRLYHAMYADFQCTLTGFPSSQKLEVYDLVTVTHTLPVWSAKKFIILDKTEDEYGRPTFLLEAYYAGVFDDAETPFPESYFSGLLNPLTVPSTATNINATLAIPGTGFDYLAVIVSFVPPKDAFYSYSKIYASNDDSTYYEVGTSSGQNFVINGLGTIYEPDDTCYIKLVSVSEAGITQDLPTSADASVIISGQIKSSSFYAGLYDLWGGNEAIDHADTKIVIGNLDGTPKIALGASADAITFAGTQSGFYADGDGNLRVGGTQSLKWNPSTSRLTIGEWIISPNGISDNFTEANATILLDKTNALMRLGATSGDYLTVDGANQRIRSSNYVSGVFGAGFTLESDLLEVGNIACRGIFRTAVFQKDVVSCVGGNLAVLPADVLDTDMTAADSSTLTIEGNENFAVGDFLRIKDGVDDEWFEVTNIGSAPTYTVTRDKAGDFGANANPAWKKGASVINFGQSGDGAVYMTASETNAPYLSVFTHTGNPWTALTTRVRIGNLNGFLGYSSDLYGIAIGETNSHLKYDPTNGLKIKGLVEIIGASGLQNMLMNGGFEETDGTNAYYWETGAGITTETTGGDNSNKYFKLVRSGTSIYSFYKNPDNSDKYFEVNEGEVYEFGCSVKTDGAATGCINIRSSDKDKTNFTYISESSTSTTWTTISKTYTIPAGRKFLNLYIQNAVANGWTSFDNAYLKRIDETAWSFTHVSDRTKIDGGDIYANSITLASAGSDFDLATITGDLDDISNGASYGRVALTAISAGKILLTSVGVTGTLPTSLSAAKCTDANADQTSVNTAADITGQGSLATLNTVNATYIDAGSITLVKCAVETTNQMFSSAANRTNIEAWRHASDATLIDGGDIYADSITATQIILGTNLLPNSDFSSWDANTDAIYWDGYILRGNDAYLKEYHGYFEGAVRCYSSYYIPVRPNTTYVLSAWLNSEISGTARVEAIEYDINKANPTNVESWKTDFVTGGTWTRKEMAKRTNATTYFVRIACLSNTSGKWGGFDCIQFEQAGPDGSDLASIAKASEWSSTGVTQIHGGQIVTDNLAVINADMGAITAGTITMPNTGWIKGGQTDFATGTGFFLGYSGAAYKFSFGDANKYIKWDGSALTMSDGLVQRQNFPLFATGDLLEIFSDTVVNTNSLTPDKVKEIYIVRKGSLRIKFSMAGAAVVTHARVYQNDVAVGILRTGTGVGAWVEHSQDIGSWNPGDYVQIYAWNTDGNNVDVKHFRLYSNKPCVNLVIL